MRTVTREEVDAAFHAGGYTIDERYPECGFVYFPTGTKRHLKGAEGRDHPDQGRVFWNVEQHEYPDNLDGRQQAQIDKVLGKCLDSIDVSSSWGRATDKQQMEIEEAIRAYVVYCRRAKVQKVVT